MREREIECYDTPSRHHGDGGSHQRVSSDRHQQSIYGDSSEHFEYGGCVASEWRGGRGLYARHHRCDGELHGTRNGAFSGDGDGDGDFPGANEQKRVGAGDYYCYGGGDCGDTEYGDGFSADDEDHHFYGYGGE